MERYQRQMTLFGPEGQAKLTAARVLVVGVGGLGSVCSLCLAGMGVGHLALMDGDTVSLSNLDRQFLYTEADIGRSKAEAAAERLRAQNSAPDIRPIQGFFDRTTPAELVRGFDLVLAATDDQESRLALNAACCGSGISLISGGVAGMYGTLQVVLPGQSPCLACAGGVEQAERAQPSPAPVVSALSALMARAATALLLGQPVPTDHLLFFDGAHFTLEHIPLRRRDDCPHCGGLWKGTSPC